MSSQGVVVQVGAEGCWVFLCDRPLGLGLIQLTWEEIKFVGRDTNAGVYSDMQMDEKVSFWRESGYAKGIKDAAVRVRNHAGSRFQAGKDTEAKFLRGIAEDVEDLLKEEE